MDHHRRYGSALRTVRIRIALPVLLVGLLMIAAWLETAGAQETDARSGPHSLAGWWLSVDNFWPRLRNEAGAAVFEELLIVDEDGTVENRAVFFQLPGEEACSSDSTLPCSDAPLIATARFSLDNGVLGFEERRDGNPALFGSDSELDRRLRGSAVTGVSSWIGIAHDGELALTSSDGQVVRKFIRVSPDLLRRLRAGIIVASVSVADHWRCYVEHVLKRWDAAGRHLSDQLVENYLYVASYALSLLAASRTRPHELDAATLPGGSRHWMMIEDFEDVRAPQSDAEGAELDARLAALMRTSEQDVAGFTAVELTSFATILSHGEEARHLFCLD